MPPTPKYLPLADPAAPSDDERDAIQAANGEGAPFRGALR